MITSPETTPAAAGGRSPAEARKWGPILVGTDGSEMAGRAVDAAAGLAAALDVELWIAQVIDATAGTAARQFERSEGTSVGDATEAMAHRLLIEAAGRADVGGAKRLHTVLRWGSCAEELVTVAREVGANTIVVGRRGAGGRLAQALMGSVSQKLAGISPVNLVIVP